jgi:hypothetical protein
MCWDSQERGVQPWTRNVRVSWCCLAAVHVQYALSGEKAGVQPNAVFTEKHVTGMACCLGVVVEADSEAG